MCAILTPRLPGRTAGAIATFVGRHELAAAIALHLPRQCLQLFTQPGRAPPARISAAVRPLTAPRRLTSAAKLTEEEARSLWRLANAPLLPLQPVRRYAAAAPRDVTDRAAAALGVLAGAMDRRLGNAALATRLEFLQHALLALRVHADEEDEDLLCAPRQPHTVHAVYRALAPQAGGCAGRRCRRVAQPRVRHHRQGAVRASHPAGASNGRPARGGGV